MGDAAAATTVTAAERLRGQGHEADDEDNADEK